MSENDKSQKAPNPERLDALRNLPKDVLETLSKEEVQSFLHDKDWPDSLREKLRDYLVD